MTATAGQPDSDAITSLSVAGFESIADEQTIEIRPLTLLAGTNSSGKSSMLQPLLLLKQTLESPFDPGALLLDGPNVRFSSAEQLLFRGNSAQTKKCVPCLLRTEPGHLGEPLQSRGGLRRVAPGRREA
ncbi:MAG: hypothetical protein ACRD0K_03045 [Egibacteraceae bacterium]